ncbi:MAG: hypothetical protein A3J74_10075 [Elusimicrobia bacterium RIFCSPHIGHO2_02_FULL_57_9]|nr:MAG: hypothetical protein A3J74_10075 [Elusimicrobia bacterium RIFCSPHIGHO2_02_FULL_57_9]
MKFRLLALCLPGSLLSACVFYPKPHWTVKSGQAQLQSEKLILVKAELIKSCETSQGESEQILKSKETMTDSKGRYKLRIAGLVWNWRNLMSQAECSSRVQMYLCREGPDSCVEADDVDITVLGK